MSPLFIWPAVAAACSWVLWQETTLGKGDQNGAPQFRALRTSESLDACNSAIDEAIGAKVKEVTQWQERAAKWNTENPDSPQEFISSYILEDRILVSWRSSGEHKQWLFRCLPYHLDPRH